MPTRRPRSEPRPRRTRATPTRVGDVHTLTDLEQVRMLADPIRLRIMEILCLGERTTKQVAQELEEKPTRLYHHVEALERVGLVRLTRTRQNRGTIEKYYRSVARAFRVHASVFSAAAAGDPARDEARSVPAALIERTAAEFRDRAAAPGGGRDVRARGVLTYLEIRGDEGDMARIRDRLARLVAGLGRSARVAREPEKAKTRRYRLTIAFFPLDDE